MIQFEVQPDANLQRAFHLWRHSVASLMFQTVGINVFLIRCAEQNICDWQDW